MNSKILERILLIMLAAVNIFLAITFVSYKENRGTLTQEAVANAEEILKKRGLNVSDSSVMTVLQKKPTFHFTMSEKKVKTLVAALVGSDGKLLYGSPDSMLYIGKNVSVEIRKDNSIIYINLGLLIPESEKNADEDVIYPEAVMNSDNSGKYSEEKVFVKVNELLSGSVKPGIEPSPKQKKLLEELTGGLTEVSFEDKTLVYLGGAKEDGLEYFAAVQIIEGLPVCDKRIVFVFSGNELVYISGSFIFIKPDASYSLPMIDGINALFGVKDITGDVICTELCYGSVFHSETGFYMIPTYQIEFSDGKKVYVDGVSGVVKETIIDDANIKTAIK
ncbi:hypothetical protein SDC9_105996 [bioreactor metagenome]|uniref:Regulatory protein YycH-like domain-containing protein n=1 Tax=bioreactor metagenome TaxID=1076179 RepID=A0A645B165_9ZZZZ|nr:hypothetical protein [Oscillospiraceae bacterium]